VVSSDEVVEADVLNEVVAALAQAAPRWSATSLTRKIELLERVVRDTAAIAPAWNEAACAAKDLDPEGTTGGEELLSGIGSFVRVASLLAQSLRDLRDLGRPQYPGPVRHEIGNRLAIQVLPTSVLDRVLYTGLTGEVWFRPGVDEATIQAQQAWAYQPGHQAQVSLVLGAGNVASLGPRDALDKLFVEGHVVVVKANPVNDYLVPYWRTAMAALIDEGVLTIVTGGASVGRFLVEHPLVTDLHVTGSDKTHDAIVYGVGEEGQARKAADQPLVTKPLSSELGNVSPVVIVPGEWTPRELRYQAAHVATMLTNNAGFNCLTPRVLVTHAGWAQREEFLTMVGEVLATMPSRRAYYPGARDRWERFLERYPQARTFGTAEGDRLPWTVVTDVAPSSDEMALTVEAFCSLMAESPLEAPSTEEFLDRATDFCNDVVWGTLSMTVLIDPRTMARPTVAAALDRAVAALRYGSIGVNAWHAVSFLGGSTTWGAYPGHPRTDIQSGRGVVGNTYLFRDVEKSVVRGPFVAVPAPAWFATTVHGGETLWRFFAVQSTSGWRGVPALLRSALRG
jgi:acyl-CoA reductase-like NAD-dependent aldehyde dehydrogenase